MGLLDAIAARAVEQRDKIVDALFAGLDVTDPAQRARCAELIITRLYGKPKETVETTSTRTDMDVSAMTFEQLAHLKARLLSQRPHLPLLKG